MLKKMEVYNQNDLDKNDNLIPFEVHKYSRNPDGKGFWVFRNKKVTGTLGEQCEVRAIIGETGLTPKVININLSDCKSWKGIEKKILSYKKPLVIKPSKGLSDKDKVALRIENALQHLEDNNTFRAKNELKKALSYLDNI